MPLVPEIKSILYKSIEHPQYRREYMEKKFEWHAYPKTAADFEVLMLAIDEALMLRGLKPFQRPLHVGRLLWEAFGWNGPVFPPKEFAERPGFLGDVLMAKCLRWYDDYYGEQLKSDFAYGFVPVKLGNAIWRVRAGVTYGTVRLFADRNLGNQGVMLGGHGATASLNILCAIENFPQGLADRLSDSALREHLEFHVFMHNVLQWREELPHTELLDMARADYEASTADVLGRRYGQARWGAQQAVEKTLKGLLRLASIPFPTGGPNGHNLLHLGGLFEQQGIHIAPSLRSLATCSPKVRYGEETSTEQQAIGANHAALGILEVLRNNPSTEVMLRAAP
jgi:HEPN domain-containing protein